MESGKNIAVISYITFVGLIIAFFMNQEKKYELASFHIRQSLGLTLTYFLIAIPLGYFDSWLVSGPFLLMFFVLWVYGVIQAAEEKLQEVPIVGKFYQQFFASIS